MSEIDLYKHERIGAIQCGVDREHWVAIYRLLEDVPEEHHRSFYASRGDILVGGGGGEAPVFRIEPEKAFHFYTVGYQVGGTNYYRDDFLHYFWSIEDGYYYGNRFHQAGWNDEEPLDGWIAENVIAYLMKEYADDYQHLVGSKWNVDEDGSVCFPHPPIEDESLEEDV